MSESWILIYFISKNSKFFSRLTTEDKEIIQKYKTYLCDDTGKNIQTRLSKIYLSMPSYDYTNICEFYIVLKHFKTLERHEALEILLPR